MWPTKDKRCDNVEQHQFHPWETINGHFKTDNWWCPGICSCGHSTPENLHGPGGHK